MLTDTDSLICKIKSRNLYEGFWKNKELVKFRHYPEHLKYYNNTNNLVIGKIKYETCGLPIKGFVGLISKVHTFIRKDNHKSKKAKDINRNVIDNELKYGNYNNVLFNSSSMGYELNRIQSKDHNIGLCRFVLILFIPTMIYLINT